LFGYFLKTKIVNHCWWFGCKNLNKMKQKVYITKYAFSSGILECEMDVDLETKSCYGKPDGFAFAKGFYGNDFHLTKEDAIKDFNKRKEKKIRSLKKQIIKMKRLSFGN
jgi:hypothetical protein